MRNCDFPIKNCDFPHWKCGKSGKNGGIWGNLTEHIYRALWKRHHRVKTRKCERTKKNVTTKLASGNFLHSY